MPQSDKPSKSASQPQTALDPLAKMKETFEQFLSSFHAQDAHPGAALIKPLELDAQKLQGLQSEFIERATKLWNDSLSDSIQIKDRRFSSEAWAQQPSSKFVAAMYLLNGEFLQKIVHAVKADEKTQARLSFAVEQYVALTSPSNFLPLNPEAMKKALDSDGLSISKGLQNLLHDVQQGHVSMTDESVFAVGKNVALTSGQVVFENPYFQLIEFAPLSDKVFEKPLLLVPPCINKYYILDLKPENSLIRHAVANGHRTFVVSWCNPKEDMAHATWDEYIEHVVLKAIEVTQSIGASKTINALGFCVGGTLLSTALGVLAAKGEQPVASLTLLTTLVDFSNTGVLDVFIDENMVKFRELQYANGGLMSGKDMAQTFSFLRPNDLVWNYVVNNYLKGESPPPFDLLYWNSDATNLPGPLYAWYLRNMYLENLLKEPGALTVCGEALDLSQIKAPVYIYGSREDHIVPIDAAYASTQIFKGKKRFVMGASGHIAGVINPPASKKRSHWVSAKATFPSDLQGWVASSKEVPGSWWDDWMGWLSQYAGKPVQAPKKQGNKIFKPLEPAPGRYVAVKV
jgi:polyhydroxyalkanoate synthase